MQLLLRPDSIQAPVPGGPPTLSALEQLAQPADFVPADLLRAEQVGEEGRERSSRQALRERLELPTGELLAADGRGEHVHVKGPIARHAPLLLEALEEALDRPVLRLLSSGVKVLTDLAGGELSVVPEELEDGELGVGQVGGAHVWSVIPRPGRRGYGESP